MFKHYLIAAFRGIKTNKLYSFINIFGLAVGMASSVLIFLWIEHEVSFDRFFSKAERIYLANNRDTSGGEMTVWNNTSGPLAPALKKDYPEVEDAVRINEYGANFLLTANDKHFSLHGNFVDSGFLDLFDFPVLAGNPHTALKSNNSIVLTNQLAIKLFGNQEAIGKTVLIDSVDYFTVSAVIRDLPSNTSLSFEYLLPWTYAIKTRMASDNWANTNLLTYILLKPGSSQQAFDAKIRNITINHTRDGQKLTSVVFTQRLKDRWLYNKVENGAYVAGRMTRVRLFAAIALLILIIACINFTNLSTARSEKRGKEVGIRKVSGALRGSLILQFIFESLLLSLIAGIIAIIGVQLVLPYYSGLVGKVLNIDFNNISYWALAIAFILFTGLLAGIYPAFYLSSFKPVSVLKGVFKKSNTVVTPRRILVVTQFTVAIALVICTIIIEKQIKYAERRNSGYARNNLAFVIEFGDARKNYELIKRGLLTSGAATAVTQTSGPLTETWASASGFSWEGSTPADRQIGFNLFAADKDFNTTMGTTLIDGRNIDVDAYKTDSLACLLNETAVKIMRLKNPVGKTINLNTISIHIIGVIKDFIIESPYEPLRPIILVGPALNYSVINFRLNPQPTIAASLEKADKVFKQYNPLYPFNVRFYDREYAVKFSEEKQTGTLAGLFAGLSIFISCLGLFALTSYMAESRVKEVGIRKVLGANVTSIVLLLSKDLLKLVFISFLISSPIAWIVMNKWLQSYSYRVGISWDVFALTGLFSCIIAFVTVIFQTGRAARANPTNSLRAQ